jgi:hypothetical protein
VNRTFALCSATTRQNVPASGVPTGLPSNKTVVAPTKSGAYKMYECPTTQPMSEAQNIVSPGPWISNRYLMDKLSPTACPPASRTTPFGSPVVPVSSVNVYRTHVGLYIPLV